MPISIREVDGSVALGYRYKLLFKDGHLFRSTNKTDHDVVLKILTDYREKFNLEDSVSCIHVYETDFVLFSAV